MSDFTCPELVASISHPRVDPTRQFTRRQSATPALNPDAEATTLQDVEKQQSANPSEFVVEWDGDDDPLCPRSMSTFRKWVITTVAAMGSLLVTCTSSLYASTYSQLKAEFHCSQEVATLGLSLFVVGLALGPMILSPLSEFFGRRPIYICSMFFFLVFLIPSAAAHNIQTMLVGRFLDGFAGSAFLSVAAGTVSDVFSPHQIQEPMMLYTLAPFIGPVLGPAIGGFINDFTNWRWSFYVLIIWAFVTFVCVVFLPETFHPVLLTRKAAALRKSSGNDAYHSHGELALAQKSMSSTMLASLYKPLQLLFMDPMAFLLCLYSALLLGVLYLFFGAFPLVFRTNHDFTLWQNGLTFLGLVVGSVMAILMNPIWHNNYLRLVANANEKNKEEGIAPHKPDPEFRLPPAILGGVLVPVGLLWFGWTTYRSIHWIVPIIGSVLFGMGILLVFSGVWTFLVAAYPRYAASALAANTFARCMFAGAFPLFGNQMYEKLGFQWASFLLACLTIVMMPLPYLFFRYGKILRSHSRFASD